MNAHGKHVDKTFLSIDTAEERGFIHRDYIAHCLRWSHIVKKLYEKNRYKTARILDIGCGRELPFAKLLYSSKLIPFSYTGVDAGPVDDGAYELITKTGKFTRCDVYENTDFALFHDGMTFKADVVVCTEVLEHVEPAHMLLILRKILELTSSDARIFISTPCWNRIDCAGNHVNEITYEALGAVFEREGFQVDFVYGTFASQRDYKSIMAPAQAAVFDMLQEYYDSNFLSCIFAPMFPSRSRNCLWELSRAGNICPKYPILERCQQPWSSSELWRQLES